MTSQRVERTWIRTGGYGRFRGEWVKVKVPHTTHSYTKHTHTHKKRKKTSKKRKKDRKRKLSVPVLSNGKADKIYC